MLVLNPIEVEGIETIEDVIEAWKKGSIFKVRDSCTVSNRDSHFIAAMGHDVAFTVPGKCEIFQLVRATQLVQISH